MTCLKKKDWLFKCSEIRMCLPDHSEAPGVLKCCRLWFIARPDGISSRGVCHRLRSQFLAILDSGSRTFKVYLSDQFCNLIRRVKRMNQMS